jgi:hypothetical protein
VLPMCGDGQPVSDTAIHALYSPQLGAIFELLDDRDTTTGKIGERFGRAGLNCVISSAIYCS